MRKPRFDGMEIERIEVDTHDPLCDGLIDVLEPIPASYAKYRDRSRIVHFQHTAKKVRKSAKLGDVRSTHMRFVIVEGEIEPRINHSGRESWGALELHFAGEVLVDLAIDGDAGATEDMGHLSFAQARGVVFEGEVVLLFVDAEAAKAVGVGKFAEASELFEAERRLQFKGDFEECHESKYKCKERRSEGGCCLTHTGWRSIYRGRGYSNERIREAEGHRRGRRVEGSESQALAAD